MSENVSEKTSTESEQDKYVRMWGRPEYRRYSPGAEAAPDAIKFMRTGQTCYDLGCGTGRAGNLLADSGIDVTLVDFAPNGCEQIMPYIQACIWEMELPHSDWIFCVDVLEHIPQDRIDEALQRIAKTCDSAYLQIHCEKDGCGVLIGETLHMTVMPPEWWLAKVAEYMPVKRLDKGYHSITILAGKHVNEK